MRLLWPAVCLVAASVAVLPAVSCRRHEKPGPGPLDGYQSDVSILSQEYRKFHGKLLRDPELEQQFRLAADAVARKNYPDAINILEAASKDAAVPIVFNDLGAPGVPMKVQFWEVTPPNYFADPGIPD